MSYLPIGMYLLDVTIVYHISIQIAISKIYEINKNILFKKEKIRRFSVCPLHSVEKCVIIKE